MLTIDPWRSFQLFLLFMCACAPLCAVEHRGDRILAIDVSEADDGNFVGAFELARRIDMRQIGISLDWSAIETSPGVYDLWVFSTANSFYPAYGVGVCLTLRPAHTFTRTMPADLESVAFDDPAMAARFIAMVDAVMATMTQTQVDAIVVGSELDGVFGSDSAEWARYTSFYTTVAAHIHNTYPAVRVGAEVMYPAFTGSMGTELAALNGPSDIIAVSLYPIEGNYQAMASNAVSGMMTTVVNATSKPIWFTQFGYPSDQLNGSSEVMQADFITAAFSTWDANAARIEMIDFTWQHDRSPAQLAADLAFYGDLGEEFTAFLASLGLRNYDNTDKLAWLRLASEAGSRGWWAGRRLQLAVDPAPPGGYAVHHESLRWDLLDGGATFDFLQSAVDHTFSAHVPSDG